jgi:hypothetical protein
MSGGKQHDLVHAVLAGLNESQSKGGLIIRKKKEDGSSAGFVAPPGGSRLGLDKLAVIKERERREAEALAAKKRQLEDDGGGTTPGRGGKFIRKEIKDKEFR